MTTLKSMGAVSLFIIASYLFISLFILILTPAPAKADIDWWEGDSANTEMALDNWWDRMWDDFETWLANRGDGIDLFWWLRK